MELKPRNSNVLYITNITETVNVPGNTYDTVIVLAETNNIILPNPTNSIIGANIKVRNLTGVPVAVKDHNNVILCNVTENNYTWIVLMSTGYEILHCSASPLDPVWQFKYDIPSPLGPMSQNFGHEASLSEDGGTLALSYLGDIAETGSVYMYTRSGFIWNFHSIINPIGASLGGDFGTSIQLNSNGTRLIVGASVENAGQGAVWVFELVAGVWTQIAKIVPPDATADALVGTSVSINAAGNIIAFGGPQNFYDGEQRGSVWIYNLIAGVWTYGSRIDNNSPAGFYSRFGTATALNAAGNIVAIGNMPLDAVFDPTFGSISVFENTGTWTAKGSVIIPATSSFYNLIGSNVTINATGNVIAFGNPIEETPDGLNFRYGKVWIYKFLGDWTEYDTITEPVTDPQYIGGICSLDSAGTTLAFTSVLTKAEDPEFTNICSIYIYDEIGGVWTRNTNLIAGPNDPYQLSGFDLSGDGHFAALNIDLYIGQTINLYSNL